MSIPKKIYYSPSAGIFHVLSLPKEECPDIHEYVLQSEAQKHEDELRSALTKAQEETKKIKADLIRFSDYEDLKSEINKQNTLLSQCGDAIRAAIPFCKKMLVANAQPGIVDEFCSVNRKITPDEFPFFTSLCEVAKKI